VGAAAYQGWIPLPGWHQEKKPEPVNPKPTDLGPMIKLSPLTLNLKEGEGGHYLKTTIVLEIGQKEWAPEVQGRISALTDLMIITLCDKSLEDLRRPEAKDHLKKELLAKANQSLDGQKIKQIYFDEFLFQ
jgi:flagellar basal body-associated protein FliL